MHLHTAMDMVERALVGALILFVPLVLVGAVLRGCAVVPP